MKKAIFLVFFTILGLCKPALLRAMDKPQKFATAVTIQFDDKPQVVMHLKTYVLTYQVSRLVKQKLEALKVIKEYSHLVRLLLSIIVERKVPNTPFKKQLNTLLQVPECKVMLLQCRSSNPFKKGNCNEENLHAFSEICIRIAKTLDHPLINKISQWLKANNKIYEIYCKSIELFDASKETPLTRKVQTYFELHNATFKLGGTVDTEQIADLQAWIDAFEEKKIRFVAYFSKLIEHLPVGQAEKFQKSFIPYDEIVVLLEKNIGADWGELALNYTDNKDSSICELVRNRIEEKKREEFFPPETRAFEEKKKKNQQNEKKKKTPKNKRKKTRRRKNRPKSVAIDIPSVETGQEEVPTITFAANETKSSQELLVSKLQSYYPGVEKISLFPHRVQFTDRITKHTFILYNATGNTDYQNAVKFGQLAQLPKLHRRVTRWNKDIDQAIVQAQYETGKTITGDDRKDWIKEHQIPVAVLYYFRSMGHKRTFIDADGTKINCLYLVGRLKAGKYTRDGYFGLGFLPDAQVPTIYHACFESKSFMQILVQDEELTPEQKMNLSSAFKLQNKKS